ncbi:MAG: Fic family protein [Parcubacteria group bacterium]|nr:Fic family protein [Parcubacteria group bacterium]
MEEHIKRITKKKAALDSLRPFPAEIHRLILSGIDDTWAGRYRAVSVRVAGSTVVFPNPTKVPELMKEFSAWLSGGNPDHALKTAIDAHLKLITIHPFVDGNGSHRAAPP